MDRCYSRGQTAESECFPSVVNEEHCKKAFLGVGVTEPDAERFVQALLEVSVPSRSQSLEPFLFDFFFAAIASRQSLL